MTKTQVKEVLIDLLNFFKADKKLKPTTETVIGEAITNERNQKLYQGSVNWSLEKADHKIKSIPKGWRDMTVGEVLYKLTLMLLLLIGMQVQAQTYINIGTVKTDLRKTALNIGFSYIRSLDSMYSGKDLQFNGKKSFVMVTPEIDFKSGTEDAFSSVIAKADILVAKFRTTRTANGIEIPDAGKTMHVFPISIGAESNNRLDFLNGLVEVGYSPFYQTINVSDFLRASQFGIYLQGGYKFHLPQATDSITGGDVDQSGEDPHEGILRVKGNVSLNTNQIVTLNAFKVGLVGEATAWYNFLNKDVYYSIDGIARIYLTSQLYFDVQYTRGSGAPLFNKGDQWGAGLTVQF